jgi:hypothetical protein
MFVGVETLTCAGNVCRFEGAWAVGSKMGMAPPPGVFLRKDVILGELSCEIVQGCDFRGFTTERSDPAVDSEDSSELVGTITAHGSIDC